jgi:tRNA-splicing ligase RtcB
MSTLRITGVDLKDIGFKEGREMGIALTLVRKEYKHSTLEEVKAILREVLEAPSEFLEDEILSPIAIALTPVVDDSPQAVDLNEVGVDFNTFGGDNIEDGAIAQMNVAARLPVAVRGALMPDAHAGYGLPIGGVLAVDNAVIPYGVGVDIGCRMCLTVYDLDASYIDKNHSALKRALKENSFFGTGCETDEPIDHAILNRSEFEDIAFIRNLKDKAWKQLGTSGAGNHFLEVGSIDLSSSEFGLNPGRYLAILSHSGSRGLGARIADYYTKVAIDVCRLPSEAKHLAWLDLNTEAGMEYWIGMNLAGDYASACHDVIHKRMAKALGITEVARVENHHNFAWKEIHDGRELIVHRKGATPAGEGVMGIIPGSMATPGYVVRGKGSVESLHSASHGAGRAMSRTQAKKNFSKSEMKKFLDKHDVVLIGGGIDESPMAYKDIDSVMAQQTSLVDVVGKFMPRIVRMASE